MFWYEMGLYGTGTFGTAASRIAVVQGSLEHRTVVLTVTTCTPKNAASWLSAESPRL